MYASFPRTDEFSVEVQNLATCTDSLTIQMVFSPACDAGVKDDERFLIALLSAKGTIERILALVEYTER